MVLGMVPRDSIARQLQASCCIINYACFILGIKGSSFILEVEIIVGFTLEEKSFGIFIFSVRKIVIVLVL